MTLGEAQLLAMRVRERLLPLCLRAEIAGSVRREKPDGIKDVEIVAVPNAAFLFELAQVVNGEWGPPGMGRFPAKYTKIRGAANLDLFWCSRETFGLNFFIRTGSDAFVARALARWKMITHGGYSECARLHRADGTVESTPEELAVFRLLELEFVPPREREGKLKDQRDGRDAECY